MASEESPNFIIWLLALGFIGFGLFGLYEVVFTLLALFEEGILNYE